MGLFLCMSTISGAVHLLEIEGPLFVFGKNGSMPIIGL